MAEPRLITAAEAALDDLGDVKGPGPVTDGNIALFDGPTGTLLKAAGVVEGVATIDSTTNVLIGDGAGNAIDSGSAIGDLGSLLTANTARVDASGSDETGTIGNLSKPFLTVQAAIAAILAQESFDSSAIYVIDIGANQFGEDLAIDSSCCLLFKGASAGVVPDGNSLSVPWISLTLTASATILVKDCVLGPTGITTSEDLNLMLDNVDVGGNPITSTGTGTLVVMSPSNSGYNVQTITADDISTLRVIGLISKGNNGGDINVANSSPDILVRNCVGASSSGTDPDVFDIVCGGTGPSVNVVNSTMRNIDLGTGGFLTLINSKVLGTITANSASIDASGVGIGISFPEADPLIAGAPYWDGATLKKSAGP